MSGVYLYWIHPDKGYAFRAREDGCDPEWLRSVGWVEVEYKTFVQFRKDQRTLRELKRAR